MVYSNDMQFIPLTANRGAYLFGLELHKELQEGQRVLWLISGGSNIPVTLQAMQQLPEEATERLMIVPVDERYGPPGHPASNVQQLLDQGFTAKRANFFTPLDGSPLEDTVARYGEALQQAFHTTDKVIGQLGIGADGHIAGILPQSPALQSKALVAGYQAADYTRITLTFLALRQIDAAYVFAYGREKRAALDRLCDGDYHIEDQPAQILRDLSEVYIYNDLLEERNA